MSSKKISFVDSTLRDGQEALLGGRLRTDLVAPILESLDTVGFESIEAWGGGTFRSTLSLLHQDPWERLRALKKKLKRTPLQMHVRGRFLVGDRLLSFGLIERFLNHAAELGVDIVRLVDPFNNLEELARVAKLAQKAGLNTQLSVLCSDSLIDLSYYERLITRTDLSNVDALGIFDPWGTLSPAFAIKVVELLRRGKNHRIFVHLHKLRNAGPTALVAATEGGASIVDTCFSAFSCDGSLPSIEEIFSSLHASEASSNLNPEALVDVSNAFMRLRNEYFDRVPGVMQPTSSIEKSMREIAPTFSSVVLQRISRERSEDYAGLREETLQIMDELGLVALVAPVSEIVARQAVLNLHSKTRYFDVTNEFLSLLRGELGVVGIQKGFSKRFANSLNFEAVNSIEEIEEHVPVPPYQHKISEDDALSFALYPQEFIELKEASFSVRQKGKQMVVAAALALLSEMDLIGKTPRHAEPSVNMVANSTRWRDALRTGDMDLLRKRGFVQEPF